MTPSELANLLKRTLPAVDHRGEIIEEIGPDFVTMRLPVVDSYLSHDLPAGSGQVVLSGPTTLGFAETSMYACVHSAYGSDVLAVVMSLNASFFRVAGAGDLLSTARLLRRGRSVAFVEAKLYSASSREPCTHVTASYAIKVLHGQ